MEKRSMDWSRLGFGYQPTNKRFVTNFRDGAWDAGCLTGDSQVVISECAGVLQYAQTCFEGLKAYTTKDGSIVCFRPELNARRMAASCRRLCMPEYPEEQFLEAVKQTVLANAQWVPPYGYGASLYLRPVMFGTGAVLGVKPSDTYQFRIFASPVGSYFHGNAPALSLRVCPYDRAAPHGTGHVKAGLNYAMSLYPITEAHAQGFDENVYLDAATRTHLEETGGANLLFVKGNTLITPQSSTILPSITRQSLLEVARDYLGMETQERPISLDELGEFSECGLCGTAAVISPVGKIADGDREFTFSGSATLQKLRSTLLGIQLGEIPAPAGWIYPIV